MSRAQLTLLSTLAPEPEPGEDVAYTPVSRAAAIVRSILPDLGPAPLVIEAHAGGGAFLRAFREHGLSYRAREIDPAAVRLLHAQGLDCEGGDFLDMSRPLCDVSFIGNPPWSVAEEHLLYALSWQPRMVGWILPAGWLNRVERTAAVFTTPGYGCPVICPMVNRNAYGGPGRTGKSTDSRDDLFIVWARNDLLTPRFEPRLIPER